MFVCIVIITYYLPINYYMWIFVLVRSDGMGVVWHGHGKAGWAGGWMGWMVWDGMKTRYVHGCVLGRLFADGEIWRHRQTENPNNTSFFFPAEFCVFFSWRYSRVSFELASKQAKQSKQSRM